MVTQGVPAAAPRPRDVRDDRRHSDHPADALRLRDQHRSQAHADRDHRRRPQRVHALASCGDDDVRVFQTSSASCPTRKRAARRSRRAACSSCVTIPADFTRKLLRGERPVAADRGRCLGPDRDERRARRDHRSSYRVVARKDLIGPLAAARGHRRPPFDVHVHRLYNPESITQYNIVPGLMGVILTMTLVMMTGLAITRERERGTMENLLAMPVTPLEVMTGKIVPYIAIGLIQATIILLAARYIFDVPFVGSVTALYGASLLFIACNLTVGITLSSLARNQLQAMQLTFFYFLPNILLSGFMFPFRGMPEWAQWHRQRAAAHVLQPAGPRHPAQGQRLARPVAEPLAAHRVRARRDGDRGEVLSQDARLKRIARSAASHSPARAARSVPISARRIRRRSTATCPASVADIAVEPRPDRDIPAEWWTVFGRRRSTRSCSARSPTARRSTGARARVEASEGAARRARGRHRIRTSTRRPAPCGSASIRRRSAFRRRRIPARSTCSSLGAQRVVHVRPLRRHAARARGAGGRGRLPGLRARRRAPDARKQRRHDRDPAGGARARRSRSTRSNPCGATAGTLDCGAPIRTWRSGALASRIRACWSRRPKSACRRSARR